MNFALALHSLIGIPTAIDRTRDLVVRGECATALDIGCGESSRLSAFRPAVRTTGMDAHAESIEAARRNNAHDDYVTADVLEESADSLLEKTGGRKFDLVTLYDLIEHVPKRRGYELLEKCEQLSGKFVLVQTPNGFLPQGPDHGNERQRHLSGWFAHDFEGLGYKVYGSVGTKYLRGYAANAKYSFPGWNVCDVLLARALRAHRRTRHAFGLVAVKDVRGVPARFP